MPDRLPSLTALRAFDAAARHMSFARAADELNVTPAALSFQIKSLEQHLGQPVFRRLNRAVELTPAGHALQSGVQEGFEALIAAWRAARRVSDTETLTVTAGPAFTAKWLAPRLYAFARDHPKIEIRFLASLRLLDLARDDVDIAVRFGLGPDPGVSSRPLIREWVTPMMAPDLASRIHKPEDLLEQLLYHQEDFEFVQPPINWKQWFLAAGISQDPPAGLRFSQADHAIDAAVAGDGIVLGRISLATPALRQGHLVAPFELCLSTDAHYRFLCPLGTEERPQVKAFYSWLREELAIVETLSEGRRIVPSPGAP